MNRMQRIFFLLCFIVILSESCHQPDKLTQSVNRMADMECRAINLRNQRFELANKMRFASDTLLQKVSLEDSIRIQNELVDFTSKKEMLLQQSNRLADTVHQELDALRKGIFKNADDKKLFDQKLKDEIQKRKCL